MHEHARGQTDGRTDSNIRPQARVHANTRTYALMNVRMYDQTFGRSNVHADRQTDRQTNGQTDGRTHTYALTNGRMHTHLRYYA